MKEEEKKKFPLEWKGRNWLTSNSLCVCTLSRFSTVRLFATLRREEASLLSACRGLGQSQESSGLEPGGCPSSQWRAAGVLEELGPMPVCRVSRKGLRRKPPALEEALSPRQTQHRSMESCQGGHAGALGPSPDHGRVLSVAPQGWWIWIANGKGKWTALKVSCSLFRVVPSRMKTKVCMINSPPVFLSIRWRAMSHLLQMYQARRSLESWT